jgi:hypothetical protein
MHFPSDGGYILSRRDNGCRSIRTLIFERPVRELQKNPAASEICHRGNGSLRNRHYTLTTSKLSKLAGFLEPATDIAACCRPLKHDNGIEAYLSRRHRG